MNSILFVDDEPLILNALKRGLVEESYIKFFATSGEDALKIMKNNEISVLVTDMKMPGMSGLDLLKIVKSEYPDVVKLVLSGYTQLPQVLVTINQGDIFKFITKPWNLDEELIEILSESIDYYNYRVEMRRAQEGLEKKNITFQNILKTYDDKIDSMRDEIMFMKDMNRRWMQYALQQFVQWNPQVDQKESIIGEMVSTQRLLNEAFDLIPMNSKRFNLKLFTKELSQWLLEKKLVMKVEFGIKSEEQLSIKGRYELLLFLVRNLIKWNIKNDESAVVRIVITTQYQDELQQTLNVVIEANENDYIDTNSRQTYEWFEAWIVRYSGTLLTKNMNGRRAIVVSMVYEN